MIHHISISAREPRRTADLLAELIGGYVVPAPPNFLEDSWFVLTGDEHGTLVEVMPDGTELRPDGEEAGFARAPVASPYNACHALISVKADVEQVMELGLRAGWLTRRCRRGPFEVIECWIDNRQMIEIATPAMAQEYLDFFTNPVAIQAALAQFAAASPERVAA